VSQTGRVAGRHAADGLQAVSVPGYSSGPLRASLFSPCLRDESVVSVDSVSSNSSPQTPPSLTPPRLEPSFARPPVRYPVDTRRTLVGETEEGWRVAVR
jgi:hypothetical protein